MVPFLVMVCRVFFVLRREWRVVNWVLYEGTLLCPAAMCCELNVDAAGDVSYHYFLLDESIRFEQFASADVGYDYRLSPVDFL